MKQTFLMLMLGCLLSLSGCWDLREINDLGLVMAVGIDKAPSPNQFSVTVQIADPSSSASGSGQGRPLENVWIATAAGESLFDAVRKLAKIASRRIMWAHNSAIIIGEGLAKEGIIPVVDYFTHNPELRMTTNVVVGKGQAKDYIVSNIGMDDPPGLSLVRIDSYRKLTGESVESTMLKVSADLHSAHIQPLLAAVQLDKSVIRPEKGKSAKGTEQQTLKLTGAAVFRADKMVGWLSAAETRGVEWILNGTHNTIVTVVDPDYRNKHLSVETNDVKAVISVDVSADLPRISIQVSGKADLVEEDGSTNLGMNEVKQHLATLVNKKLTDEIRATLNVVQKQYKVDVLGFCGIIHDQHHQEWETRYKTRWAEIYPKIPVAVTVDFQIVMSSLKQEPQKVDRKAG